MTPQDHLQLDNSKLSKLASFVESEAPQHGEKLSKTFRFPLSLVNLAFSFDQLHVNLIHSISFFFEHFNNSKI